MTQEKTKTSTVLGGKRNKCKVVGSSPQGAAQVENAELGDLVDPRAFVNLFGTKASGPCRSCGRTEHLTVSESPSIQRVYRWFSRTQDVPLPRVSSFLNKAGLGADLTYLT